LGNHRSITVIIIVIVVATGMTNTITIAAVTFFLNFRLCLKFRRPNPDSETQPRKVDYPTGKDFLSQKFSLFLQGPKEVWLLLHDWGETRRQLTRCIFLT